MSAWELNRLVWCALDAAGFAVLGVLRVVAVLAIPAAVVGLGWVLDGCPSLEQAAEMYISEVKGGE